MGLEERFEFAAKRLVARAGFIQEGLALRTLRPLECLTEKDFCPFVSRFHKRSRWFLGSYMRVPAERSMDEFQVDWRARRTLACPRWAKHTARMPTLPEVAGLVSECRTGEIMRRVAVLCWDHCNAFLDWERDYALRNRRPPLDGSATTSSGTQVAYADG